MTMFPNYKLGGRLTPLVFFFFFLVGMRGFLEDRL